MASDGSLWRAIVGRPRRFLLSWWPWRCVGYLLGAVVIGLILLCVLPLVAVFPPALVLVGLPVGAVERRRLGRFERTTVDDPHTVPPPGLAAWLRRRLGEGATWRELGYALCLASVLLAVDLVAVLVLLLSLSLLVAPLYITDQVVISVGSLVVDTNHEAWVAAVIGLPAVIICGYLLSALAGAQAAFARWLLAASGAELDRRVAELASSRTRLVNAFEAERRRIERDLHDGAQQHLVLLSMTLGLAELELGGEGGRVGECVANARAQARQALAAIRELVHGIHPQVLTDLGLVAAVGELAERCPIPIEIDICLQGRLPAVVESTAYFVVSEALTNAVKHARASRVAVTGRVTGQHLSMTIMDDGTGGADPSRGTGLRGLVDRAAVIDGTLAITSPVGGPTTLRMELPCRCE